LKKGGVKADGKTFKAHLDGYYQLDLLTGKGPGTRKSLFYFDGGGGLNAVQLDREGHAWKITFTPLNRRWEFTPTAISKGFRDIGTPLFCDAHLHSIVTGRHLPGLHLPLHPAFDCLNQVGAQSLRLDNMVQ